jgi:hypothetical protein
MSSAPRSRNHMARYTLASTILLQEAGENLLVLDVRTGQYLELDNVGARMLGAIRASGEIGAAVAVLAGEYQVPVERLRDDLSRLADELEACGVLVREEP